MLTSLLLSLFVSGGVQEPAINVRAVADLGPDDGDADPCDDVVFETSLAVGRRGCMEVCISLGGIRAALSDGHSSTWIAAPIPKDLATQGFCVADSLVQSMADPVVVSVPESQGAGTFVVAALGSVGPGEVRVLLTRFPGECVGRRWEPWRAIAQPWGSDQTVDKPWLVVGDPGGPAAGDEELYLTFSSGTAFRPMATRSSDGGRTWGAAAPITVGGQAFVGEFCAQPAVVGAGPLYVAHRETGSRVVLFVGTDAPGDRIVFDRVRDASGAPLELPLREPPFPLSVPGDFTDRPVPYLVADPSSADRLFVLYHEEAPGGSNMDVWCIRLERAEGPDGPAWGWDASAYPARVNDFDDPDSADRFPDQFTPVAAVDRFGRVHAIFYDNRPHACGDPGHDHAGYGPQYDVYYALSRDGGRTWRNWNLRGCSEGPALDGSLPELSECAITFAPREYNGITIDDAGDESVVWVSYTGSSDREGEGRNRSVIYASRIVVGNP